MTAEESYVGVDFSMLPQLHLPPRLYVFDSTEEQQSFDFFRSYSVKELTELFHIDEAFWKFSVLPMSMTQPVVRYAVTALGAMHRRFSDGGTTAVPEDSTDSQTRFALEQSNRSIKALLETTGSGTRPEKVSTLIACILYTCLASIQGHQTQSIIHFRNGLKLLDNLHHPEHTPKSSMTCYDNQIQSFVTTLSSLEAQARSLLCEENLPPWTTRMRIRGSLSSQEHVKFGSLSEARDFFESILNDFQCFVLDRDADSEWLLSPDASPSPTATEAYDLLVKKHSAGVNALNLFITQQIDLRERDDRMLSILKLHILVVEMYLKAYPLSVQFGELTWDYLDDYYVKIVHLSRKVLGCADENLSTMISSPAEVEGFDINSNKSAKVSRIPQAASLLRSGTSQQRRPVFTFSQGVVGPLSTVAFQCRSPTVRREAIALLLLYPRREGLWDSHTAGRLDWEIMCLEEELARQSRGQREGCFQVNAASDIPLDCRIRTVDMTCTGARVGRVRLNTVKESGKAVKILEW